MDKPQDQPQTKIEQIEIPQEQSCDMTAGECMISSDQLSQQIDDQSIAYRMSKAMSIAMHPFLIPTYAVSLLLFSDTIMKGVPTRLKLLFVSVVVLNTIIVPTLFILLMRTGGYLRDFSLSQRRDRIAPLLVVAVCYVMCAFMISDAMVAFLIRKFLFAAIACISFALIVNFFWKISLHMIAASGALAMLLLVNISGFGSMLWTLIIGVLLVGGLASARLYLGAHNPWQVAMGFLGGFIVASSIMLLM